MSSRVIVTTTVLAAFAAIGAVVLVFVDQSGSEAPPAGAAPARDDCMEQGTVVRLHPVTSLRPPARWVFAPDVVLDPNSGRATIAFAAAPRGSSPSTSTSLQSADLPSARVGPLSIRFGSKDRFPMPYNGESYGEFPGNSLGVDGAGNQIVLWREQVPAPNYNDLESTRLVTRGRVMAASRRAGGTWTAPTVLDSHLRGLTDTHLAVNRTGAAVAVWAEDRMVDLDRYVRVIRLYGSFRGSPTGSWSSPNLLSQDRLGPSEKNFGFRYAPQVGIDRAGNALVMYERRRGMGAWVRRRDVTTHSWAHATRISAASPNAGESLAVSADGTAIVSLHEYVRTKNVVVWVTAKMRTNGSWQAPRRVRPDPGTPVARGIRDAPVPQGLAVDGHGRALVVWREAKSNDLMVMERRVDGTWRRSTVLAPSQRRPVDWAGVRIAMNDRGDAFVVWEAGRFARAQLRGRYRPAGGPWSPVRRLTPAGIHPDEYAAAIGERGEAAVTWTQIREGSGYPSWSGPSRDVHARRVTPCT